MSSLSVTTSGLTLKSPIMVASGPLTDSVELVKRAEECGAGAVSTKLTLLNQPIKGYRRMYAVRGQYNFNPSDKRNDFEEGVELVYKIKQATSLPVFTNIAGSGDDLEGWQKIAKAMQEAGADALELNFCCPNMAFSKDAQAGGAAGVQIGKQPDIMHKIVRAVKEAVQIPVWAKASALGVDYMLSVKAIESAGADGIVTNGTQIAAPPIDIYDGGRSKMANLENNAFGGLVGPINRLYANRLVANVAMGAKFPIAGGGGISDWEHVVETIMFGATLTTMCTKLLWDGFDVIKDMNAKLLRFMEEQGYETPGDMRGLALRHITTSDKLVANNALPLIDQDNCVACGKCINIGSCNALSLVNKTVVVDQSKCVRCGLCGCLCPRRAISFPKTAAVLS